MTRLLGSKNAADLNVLLTSELRLSENILQSCTTALDSFVEHLKNKLKSQKEFKEIIIVRFLKRQYEIICTIKYTMHTTPYNNIPPNYATQCHGMSLHMVPAVWYGKTVNSTVFHEIYHIQCHTKQFK